MIHMPHDIISSHVYTPWSPSSRVSEIPRPGLHVAAAPPEQGKKKEKTRKTQKTPEKHSRDKVNTQKTEVPTRQSQESGYGKTAAAEKKDRSQNATDDQQH